MGATPFAPFTGSGPPPPLGLRRPAPPPLWLKRYTRPASGSILSLLPCGTPSRIPCRHPPCGCPPYLRRGLHPPSVFLAHFRCPSPYPIGSHIRRRPHWIRTLSCGSTAHPSPVCPKDSEYLLPQNSPPAPDTQPQNSRGGYDFLKKPCGVL